MGSNPTPAAEPAPVQEKAPPERALRCPIGDATATSAWIFGPTFNLRAGEPLRLSSPKELGRTAHDLFLWDVLKMLGETPPVTERVDDLPVAFAPERVVQR